MSDFGHANSDALVAHHGVLKAYFARQLRSSQDAEDYVHEVYSRVLASTARSEPVRSWKGVLLQVARSVLVDQFRRDKARQRDLHQPLDDDLDTVSDSNAADPETTVSDRQRLDAAARVLAQLDPVCRQAFLLARVEGYSHLEIARRLGIAQTAVGRHIQQALFALARDSWNDINS